LYVVIRTRSQFPDVTRLAQYFFTRISASTLLWLPPLRCAPYASGPTPAQQPEALRVRRNLLHTLIERCDDDALRYSQDFAEDPQSLLASAR
jgi:bifunctional non-homologous end joining protein LigD